MTAALEGGEWSAARPGRTLPPGKTRYTFYRRLGGPQGWSGRAENLVTGIQSWTVQPGSSVAIPTELPGPPFYRIAFLIYLMHTSKSVGEINRFESKMSLGNACCSEEQDALIGHKI